MGDRGVKRVLGRGALGCSAYGDRAGSARSAARAQLLPHPRPVSGSFPWIPWASLGYPRLSPSHPDAPHSSRAAAPSVPAPVSASPLAQWRKCLPPSLPTRWLWGQMSRGAEAVPGLGRSCTRTHRGGQARRWHCCCGQHAFPMRGLTSEGPSSLGTPLPALWGGVFPQGHSA